MARFTGQVRCRSAPSCTGAEVHALDPACFTRLQHRERSNSVVKVLRRQGTTPVARFGMFSLTCSSGMQALPGLFSIWRQRLFLSVASNGHRNRQLAAQCSSCLAIGGFFHIGNYGKASRSPRECRPLRRRRSSITAAHPPEGIRRQPVGGIPTYILVAVVPCHSLRHPAQVSAQWMHGFCHCSQQKSSNHKYHIPDIYGVWTQTRRDYMMSYLAVEGNARLMSF